MPLDYYVQCPNTECTFHDKPIALLIANPEQIAGDPSVWPTDGTARHIACPECRRVSAHYCADLADLPEDARNRHKEWIGVKLVCGQGGCKAQRRFHVLMAKIGNKAIRDELHQKLRAEYWIGHSPCDHPFSTAGHIVFDRLGFFEKE